MHECTTPQCISLQYAWRAHRLHALLARLPILTSLRTCNCTDTHRSRAHNIVGHNCMQIPEVLAGTDGTADQQSLQARTEPGASHWQTTKASIWIPAPARPRVAQP